MDPDANHQPPLPLDHRLISVYSALYRVESGAWYRNHIDWLLGWIPKECFGGLPGRECLESAWDTQGQMELAAMNGNPMACFLFDYYKFFDAFEPEFNCEMLKAVGVSDEPADMFTHLNQNAERHIKIGNTYGEALDTSNGLGQGDSFAMMSAIIYVAIQHRFLTYSFPSLKMSSVIYDRNIRG